jgi:hypothetical protein
MAVLKGGEGRERGGEGRGGRTEGEQNNARARGLKWQLWLWRVPRGHLRTDDHKASTFQPKWRNIYLPPLLDNVNHSGV